MRTYNRMQCWVCRQDISVAGAAYVSHMRKHVREGKVVEGRAPYYRTPTGYVFEYYPVREEPKPVPCDTESLASGP